MAGRRGSSFLEVQVAFAVLGVALAGLAPVVASQLRLTARVEALLPGTRAPGPGVVPGGTHYLEPIGLPWARKLGADAAPYAADVPTAGDPSPGAANVVAVESYAAPGPGDVASAEVLVEEVPEPDPESP